MSAPRLLLINPNTTASMTDAMAGRMRRQLGGRGAVRAVTGSFGFPVISDRVSYAVAAHAAIDAYERAEGEVDAIVLGCFGDPGLEALREVASIPVIGLAEAAFLAAIGTGQPFSVLTIGPAWEPMLRERLQLLSGGSLCRSVMALTGTGLDFTDLTDAKLAVLNAALRELEAAGAVTIILGGAALAGVADRLERPARLLDCLTTATDLAVQRAVAGRASDTAG